MWGERIMIEDLNILDDGIFINGDYNRLSQVLINVIKNIGLLDIVLQLGFYYSQYCLILLQTVY